MDMKKKVLCIGFTTVAVLIIMGSVFYGWYYLSSRGDQQDPHTAENSEPQPVREPARDSSVDLSANGKPGDSSEEKALRYTVREYEGHIGVFREDGTLKSEINTLVALLPEADQEKLRKGIVVNTEEELILLMESYTG